MLIEDCTSILRMADGKITPINSIAKFNSINTRRIIAKRQVETDKEDAISRQAYLLAFVVHLGKRSRKSAGEQKTCVFSPNVIDLALKLGQMEIHGSMQIREWVFLLVFQTTVTIENRGPI